jgi:hypothetical protein
MAKQAKKESQRISTKSQTDKLTSLTKVKWSIFTESETRTSCNLASEREGYKLNEWIDKVLREKAQEVLTFKALPPMKTEDMVLDLFDKFKAEMKAEQDEKFRALQEALQTRPNTVWEWLGFRKK